MFSHPPPRFCPKESQYMGEENYLKTFGFGWDPPAFWQMSERKQLFFWMFSPYSSVQFTLHPADPRHGATYHETKAKGGDGSPRKSQQQQVIQAVQIVK